MNRTVARGTAASRLWVGAMGLVLVLGFADRAAAKGIAPFGVPVGTSPFAFEAPCNRGEVLTGFFVADDFVAISPQCAIASNPSLKNQAVPEGWYGAGRLPSPDPASPGYAAAACPDIAPVLLSIRVKTLTNADAQIKSFRFFKLETFCGVDGSHPSREQSGGAYGTINIPGWQLGEGTQFCPAGQVAVGIRGSFQRSGEGLYELGLICGDPRIGSRGVLQTRATKVDTNDKKVGAIVSDQGKAPLNAAGSAPAVAVKNKADAASLNPQPLPPKTSPGAMTLNPQSLAPKTLSGAGALNSQAPAPKASSSAAMLNAQPLPQGGLQQAPSSLR